MSGTRNLRNARRPRGLAAFGNRISEHPYQWALIATLGVLTGLALAYALVSLSTVVFSIFAAAFVTLGLDPLIRFFERRGMKRGWAILTVNLMLVAVVVAMLWIVLPLLIQQTTAFIDQLPSMLADLRSEQWFIDASNGTGGVLSTVYTWVVSTITDPGFWTTVGSGALRLGLAIVSGVSTAFFIVILTLYFTATLDVSKRSIYRLISASRRERVVGYAERIMQNVGRYLSGMVILAFFNAVFSLLILTVAGVPYALVISVAAFFITLIPLVGTVITTIFMTAIALFTSPTAALIVLIGMLIYMQVEAYIFTPRVMSRAVKVPGSIVLIAALAGGTLAGLPGALVAIPVAAGILIIIDEVVVPAKERS
jgi:predicted PurR-regulated permease PerM